MSILVVVFYSYFFVFISYVHNQPKKEKKKYSDCKSNLKVKLGKKYPSKSVKKQVQQTDLKKSETSLVNFLSDRNLNVSYNIYLKFGLKLLFTI